MPTPPFLMRLHRDAHFLGYICSGHSPFWHKLTHRTLRKAAHTHLTLLHPESRLSLSQEEEVRLSEWKPLCPRSPVSSVHYLPTLRSGPGPQLSLAQLLQPRVQESTPELPS